MPGAVATVTLAPGWPPERPSRRAGAGGMALDAQAIRLSGRPPRGVCETGPDPSPRRVPGVLAEVSVRAARRMGAALPRAITLSILTCVCPALRGEASSGSTAIAGYQSVRTGRCLQLCDKRVRHAAPDFISVLFCPITDPLCDMAGCVAARRLGRRTGLVCGPRRPVTLLPKGPSLGAPLALLAQEVLEVVHQLLRVEGVVTPWARRLVARRVIGLL